MHVPALREERTPTAFIRVLKLGPLIQEHLRNALEERDLTCLNLCFSTRWCKSFMMFTEVKFSYKKNLKSFSLMNLPLPCNEGSLI